MAFQYSVETVKKLSEAFAREETTRPMRIGHYEAGTELTYEVTGVAPARQANVRLKIEKFVGGGFAGQVYRVNVLEIDAPHGDIPNLEIGGSYAMKILVPPSNSSRKFRDILYGAAFQAPFGLQVNPSASRAGALWQKFIRRGAKVRFGSERAVVDVLATFVDKTLGSCGEISEWVAGRTWRFEVDDKLLARWQWKLGQDREKTNSPEYLAKKQFMADIVKLFHDMGAPELARQYEWWTCKSQPNALKRLDTEETPTAGLTAVDFRAGLALLPFLPMSPGDVPLIFKGIARGSLVQFDRGNIDKLQNFINANPEDFADMQDALNELKASEEIYRNSQPDITHNHIRLLYSGKLWGTIFDSAVNSWEVRNITDQATTKSLKQSKIKTLAFFLLGLIPALSGISGLAVLLGNWLNDTLSGEKWILGLGLLILGPIVGRVLRAIWGRADYRKHYWQILTSWDYFCRSVQAHIIEGLIDWHRAGRIDSKHAETILNNPWLYFLHKPFSFLPAFLHRLLTDSDYAVNLLKFLTVRPIHLLLNAKAREQWLREMLADGKKNHMLTEEEVATIDSQIGEPFIQKYLKCLAVHLCTLPVTQLVSGLVAIIYVLKNPQLTTREAWVHAGVILFLFQITPISPGSIARGLFVVYLAVRERNFKDYNIAIFLGFFKYVGYLAFPIQMVYHFSTLARFMAGHWATGAVHIIPVFGERGAFLEHFIFDLFFNYPLTMRRRIRKRMELRQSLPPRAWHLLPIGIIAAAIFTALDWLVIERTGDFTQLSPVWYAMFAVPFLAGLFTAKGSGGAKISRRIAYGMICGILMGLIVGFAHAFLDYSAMQNGSEQKILSQFLSFGSISAMWCMFFFGMFATIGAVAAETYAPELKE